MSYSFNAGEVFKIAVQIEENGKSFYEESLKSIENADVKKLFAELALQEVEHKKKFESIRAQLPAASTAPAVWDPDNELDRYIKMMADQHVFVSDAGMKEQIAQIRDAKDALKMAITFEKDSVIFFLSLEDVTDKSDKEMIKSLVKEEQEHLKRLTLELMKLK